MLHSDNFPLRSKIAGERSVRCMEGIIGDEDQKSRVELAVVRQFMKEAGLTVVEDSIEKRLPPEPDVLCELEGDGVVYFELTEACAPEFAKLRSDSENTGAFAWGSDATADTLKKKLGKQYGVCEPVELLIYTNAATALPDDVLIPRLRPILGSGIGQFRRVWLFGDAVHELANRN